ncbi:MAG: hypothetical protein AAB420_03480 [Patescibacteria group bacterium]
MLPTRSCINCKKDFTIEPDDTAFYELMQVPPPTFCPDCRLQRRLAFRNDRSLYKIKCALCRQDTFSTAPQGEPDTIYCLECWSSDSWDGTTYGREYDFSRPFFEQMKELFHTVPTRARFALPGTLTNSDYTNLVSYLKNCYLIYNSDYNEYCMYGSEIESSKDCIDCTMVDTCESCYGCVNCQKCYRAFFSVDCEASSDIWFSKNLSGCQSCFGCMNLRNKNYYIFNEPHTKEDYAKKVEELKKDFNLEKAKEFWLKYPVKYIHGRQNTNVSGDYINNSKDVRNTYIAKEAQNIKYGMWVLVPPAKDCWDYTEWGDGAEKIYEGVTVGSHASNVMFSQMVMISSSHVQYSLNSISVKDCFGCVGLKSKQYCILNKQYDKESFDKLRTRIIAQMRNDGEYGEFFPITMSPFPYNETNAQEYFPLTKEQALAKGYRWKDLEEKAYVPTKKWNEAYGLDDIVLCRAWEEDSKKAQEHKCTKAFKMTKQELEFYERFGIALPQYCPNSRYFERSKFRNPLKLWHRNCAKCNKDIETSYSPDRPETVYCESCYQQEVI